MITTITVVDEATNIGIVDENTTICLVDATTVVEVTTSVETIVNIGLRGDGAAIPSNLSAGTRTATTFPIDNSYGDGVTVPEATTSYAGLLNASDKVAINGFPASIAAKEPAITATGNANQYWGGDKAFYTLNKAAVGLSNADNTSDANKPVSTATQTALDGKQPLATVLTNTTASFTTALESKLGGVASGAEVNVNADWNSISGDSQILNKPTLGTSSVLDVPASGDASGTQVVKGNDTRLTDSRTPTSHTHTVGELVSVPTASLVGRYTVGTGVAETLSLGANLAASGGVLNVVGISGATNLTTSGNTTTVTINSDTGTDATIPAATASAAGVATAAQITKLDSIATAATANSSDATLLARANHTGTQLAATISDFNSAADARVVAGITGKENTITAGTTGQYWRGDKSFQTLDKTAVGLPNADNTSDANKPISLAGMAANSTGIKTGGVLSIGTGGAGVATTFTIASGVGMVVDNTTIPATLVNVSWSAKTNVAVTNIATQVLTFVAIDSSGNVIQQATDFNSTDHRQYIVIGTVIHTNLTTVTAVNQGHHLAISPQSQLNDLLQSLAGFNISGNLFSANGTNLNLNKTAGEIFKQGANYATSANNPNIATTTSLTAATFRYNNQTGNASGILSAIDPDNYDLAGVTTAVPANKFTVQRIFLFPSNLLAVQRGQAVYNSLAEAKAAIQTESFLVNSSIIPNGILRAFLVVRQGTTALNSATNAFFLEAHKFGGTAGVGGLSVSTLQNTYDNSITPEILTDTTRGAFSVKIGTGSNSDYVYEGMNAAGATTFSVNGFGDVTGRQLNGVALTNAGSGLNLLADDGAYYLYTDFAAPLQNSYNNSIPPEILTAPGLDALILRRGTFADTDNVVVVQNNAGTVKFAVTGNGVITGGGSNGINITSDGRLYGTALHNNAGAVTGTTNQYIASGSYTPTLTNVTNVAASTARLCTWSRLGNSVTVSGQLNIDLTTTLLASEVGMSLPIPSALTTAFQLGGTANSTSSQSIWAIQADATNDRAQFKATGIVPVTNDTYTFIFKYEVL